MTDPMETLMRMGAEVRSSEAARDAAHRRLVDAFQQEEGRGERCESRSSWVGRLASAVTVGGAVVLAVVLLVVLRPSERQTSPPASTAGQVQAALKKSAELREAPTFPQVTAPNTPRLTEATADELARRLARTLPYPPGVRDDLGVLLSQTQPDMGRISFAKDGEQVAQYRSWCTWLSYWLDSRARNDRVGLQAATQVLADAPHWPSFRRNPRVQRQTGRAAQSGDLGPIANQLQLNCQNVP